ncbi:MAG: 16S rRNA (cytosine(967)-C(5))-methyltransferase RsmB [Oscillospiraceae bacterium]|nr:16S rRNA (cytosine(967)-C(5))-methyltransferase RsmB [Oscillospiraceae bacterium]
MSSESRKAMSSAAVSPARENALQILTRYRRSGELTASDCPQADNRRLADSIAFGTVQNGRYLDAVLESFVRSGLRSLHPTVREILRLSAFQILFLDRVPDSAAVNDAVTLCREQKCGFAAGFVNAVLRNLSRKKDGIVVADPAVRFSHPDWIMDRLVQENGQAFAEAFLEANQKLPDLRLQICTDRCGADDYRAMLEKAGVEVLDQNPELGSVLIRPCKVTDLPGYEEGFFYVQDDAARTAVAICGLQPGMRVLDACAAPGGKSVAAAMAGAEVLACDLSEKRLQRCRENFSRLRLEIPVCRQDAAEFRPEWENSFDCVLADVPCTGTGIIRKHPEIRDKTEEELFSLLPIQQAILRNLARYVKPGGLLLYSTCSVLRDEDENQVSQFLNEQDDFIIDAPSARKGYSCQNGMLRSWPQQNGNDGFFAAKLRKKP